MPWVGLIIRSKAMTPHSVHNFVITLKSKNGVCATSHSKHPKVTYGLLKPGEEISYNKAPWLGKKSIKGRDFINPNKRTFWEYSANFGLEKPIILHVYLLDTGVDKIFYIENIDDVQECEDYIKFLDSKSLNYTTYNEVSLYLTWEEIHKDFFVSAFDFKSIQETTLNLQAKLKKDGVIHLYQKGVISNLDQCTGPIMYTPYQNINEQVQYIDKTIHQNIPGLVYDHHAQELLDYVKLSSKANPKKDPFE